MPQYSPIAPVHMLQALQDKNLLGNYLLLLAHDVLTFPEEYDNLLFEVRDHYAPDEVFVILDNGVVENGAPVSIEELMDAAAITNPSCVVLPDVIGDFKATRKLIQAQGHLIAREYPFMFIPQGKNFDELEACIDWMAASFAIHSYDHLYWGIPRWITNKLRSRGRIIHYINAGYPNSKIHLLGMSERMTNDFKCLGLPNVMGIDSANPLVLGKNGVLMYEYMAYEHLPREDYWGMSRMNEQMVENVAWMQDAVGSA